MRPLFYWLAICGIAFSAYAVMVVIAKADQEQTKQERFTLATQRPLYAKTDVPRCWERQDEPVPVLWFVRVGDGVILVVHGEIERKC
jgi:hypothetical protein